MNRLLVFNATKKKYEFHIEHIYQYSIVQGLLASVLYKDKKKRQKTDKHMPNAGKIWYKFSPVGKSCPLQLTRFTHQDRN